MVHLASNLGTAALALAVSLLLLTGAGAIPPSLSIHRRDVRESVSFTQSGGKEERECVCVYVCGVYVSCTCALHKHARHSHLHSRAGC